MDIVEAITLKQINQCYPLMNILRPKLVESEFSDQIGRQNKQGYHLIALRDNGNPVSLLGYRLVENLILSRFLYIDDLVTEPDQRQHGHASKLLNWAVDLAKKNSCTALQLDSGFANTDAHRLYLNHGFTLSAHHLRKPISCAS